MDSVGLEISCKDCGICFLICRSCFRGQKYCSIQCRKNGYEKRRRIARDKYRNSPEAKEDHRDCQKRYRERLRQKASQGVNSGERVMDQTSQKRKCDLLIATNAPGSVKKQSSTESKLPRCWICGQIIHFVESLR